MQEIRCVALNAIVRSTKPLVLALSASIALCSTVHAATFGHARILSKEGQPLHITLPVSQLSDADIRVLDITPASPGAWREAGLVPPVDPATLRFEARPGSGPGVRVVHVESDQPFNGPVADLLLEVRTATGRQQYQVSILSPAGVKAPGGAAPEGQGTSSASARAGRPGAESIHVRRGDTMFAIARRHSVQGVSVYQMMLALQRANPQAFIDGNINLVKAGATLGMPSMAELTALSDKEARRLFMRQAREFDEYRQGLAARRQGAAASKGRADAGHVSTAADEKSVSGSNGKGDRVALSSAPLPDAADDRLAASRNIGEAQERVSQLEQNVRNLNQALQSQGEAAKNAVIDGASGIGATLSEAVDSLAQAGGPSTAGTDAKDNPKADAAAPSSSGGAAASPATSPGADAPATSASTPGQAQPERSADANQISNKAEHTVSWFQEHILGVITAILAFIVLIIAWALRRANVARDDDDHGATITDAMVKEQLAKINLDLNVPPSDDATVKR